MGQSWLDLLSLIEMADGEVALSAAMSEKDG